jgi:hypothetical protein
MLCAAYSASGTSSALRKTVPCTVTLQAGVSYGFSQCANGGSGSGDNYLRLFAPGGAQVATDDDSCGAYHSYIAYTPAVWGIFTLQQGCYGSDACTGRTAIYRT